MSDSESWPDDCELLHLSHRSDRCHVLGPGTRAVLWVQGCPLRCPGCLAPEAQPFSGGRVERVEDLAGHLADLPEIEGVTFSGGEPMSQAGALCQLIDLLRSRRELTYMAYTGLTLEDLRRAGTPSQRGLLERLDIVVDGPYIESRHTDLLWRGSDNQQVHFLSPRYAAWADRISQRGTWLEVDVNRRGEVHWMGIPPRGFRTRFEHALADRGIILKTE